MSDSATMALNFNHPLKVDVSGSTLPVEPIEGFFTEEMFDLGGDTEGFDGILMPLSQASAKVQSMTSQFFEHATSWHERHYDYNRHYTLLKRALEHTGYSHEQPTIMDFGCGTGNTTLPMLDMFPHSTVVATDLATPMLSILQHTLKQQRPRDTKRCHLVCLDLTHHYYQPESVDLVIGNDILSHVSDVKHVLAAAQYVLRPGGTAIFIEPFESGQAVLRLALQSILQQMGAGTDWAQTAEQANDNEHEQQSFFSRLFTKKEKAHAPTLNGKIKDLFAQYAKDTGEKIMLPVDGRIYRDDKWLFTRARMEDWRRDLGFSDLTIIPAHDTHTPFINRVHCMLRTELGLTPEALPDWAWEVLDRYEQSFTPDLKRDMLLDGTIIYKK